MQKDHLYEGVIEQILIVFAAIIDVVINYSKSGQKVIIIVEATVS